MWVPVPGAESLNWTLVRRHENLKVAEEEVWAVRTTVEDALYLQSEMRRLEKFLTDAEVGSGRQTLGSLRSLFSHREVPCVFVDWTGRRWITRWNKLYGIL